MVEPDVRRRGVAAHGVSLLLAARGRGLFRQQSLDGFAQGGEEQVNDAPSQRHGLRKNPVPEKPMQAALGHHVNLAA